MTGAAIPLTNEEGEAGRAARFAAVFRAELPWMCTTLRRLGVTPGDLEDVAHEVFLAVYHRLDAYDTARPLRPWLFGFAFRAASDHRRLARHRVDPDADLTRTASGAPRADEVLMQAEESRLVQAALDALDLDKRAVLVAFDMEGTPMKEVAEVLGIPLFTAYSRLRLARAELTATLKRARAVGGER